MARMNINALGLDKCLTMDRPLIDAFSRGMQDRIVGQPRTKTPLSELKGGIGSKLLTEQQQKNIRHRARERAKSREEQRRLNAKLIEQKQKKQEATCLQS